MDLLLVAKIFHVVCVMNVVFKVTHSKKIYVSNTAREDTKSCGKSEDNPCQTIKTAGVNADDNDEITIISTQLKYQDCPIYVRKPLAIRGFRGRPVIDCSGKDAFIFTYTEKIKEKPNNHPLIKIEVSNVEIQNSKAGFSFWSKTSATNLRLENVTLTNNEVDVMWKKAPLCFLVMTNVLALGRSGYAVEIESCDKTTVLLENTRFSGKYLKIISTIESSTLKISMKETRFDMRNRDEGILSTEKTKDHQFHSPMQVVTALKQTILNIKGSEFLNHFGYRSSMMNVTAFQKSKTGYTSEITIIFQSVSFRNNTSLLGSGGAISFNLSYKQTKKRKQLVLFKDCEFSGNSASNGGAVWFSDWVKKSVQFIECTFKDNKAHGKNTGSGGALSAFGGKFSITKCKFEGNTAIKSGGTLYVSNMKVTSIRITDSDFQNLKSSWSRVEGDVMYFNDVQAIFRGRVVFNLSSANSGEAMFLFEGRPAKLELSNSSVFICPKGYNYDQSKYTLETGRNKHNYFPTYHLFAFSCKPCQDLFYSTTRGSWVVNGTETRGTCHACPYGASCNGTIRARANFWGLVNGNKVEMIPCPKGYCCEREPCESYDTCRTHRTGTLCGHCSDGFTEGMSSTQCFPNEKCNGAFVWVWSFISVAGIFIFLCFHQEIVKTLVKWSLWNADDDDEDDVIEYRGNERNHNLNETEQDESNSLLSGNRDGQPINTEFSLELRHDRPDYTHIDESGEYNSGSGYSKVLYYFYQAVLLIRLSSYVSSSSFPNVVIDFLTPFLNFQFTNIWTCAGDSLRPVRKVFLKNSVVYFILGFSLITYVIYRLARYQKGINTDDQPGFQARSYPVRLVGTVIHVIILSYVAQTQCVAQLLNCVEVGGKDVLYIDGSVTCFRPYQIGVWIFFVFYIVSFPLSLFVGLQLLISRRISWREFMISCFLPFFCLLYWLYRYHKHRNGTRIWTSLSGNNNPFEAKIIYIIRHPYKSRNFPNAKIAEYCSENWEAFLIFRRLALVLVYIFAKSFLLRAYLFFIASVLFLLAHVFVQPYEDNKVNKLDNISLALIVLISGLSIAEAAYNNAGQLVPHDVHLLQYFQDWFLAMLPFFLLGMFFFPRVKHYLLRCMKKSQSNPVATDNVSEILSDPFRRSKTANEASPLTT
ncbi:uncharacterized protein LOC114519117 [Dendronephthya gigantea]|uniref:uncharacterized protein LOC114519117 n=1 Tax=Dendronephthya gigantea TaxID=151771 RepID=UPI00106DC036|nr:uncharacterized protein LOC114519117 [Dendronephthya gigantea]XP_028394986.1 uncharacterized protein LOC114519117 [Dendronephthya gigantea]XP_028394987.1 uncharacterized protein LOC114519117 [Dendronephthya gigantea]XP_028394988.1 uncharacterized protein LOC114519117 [Dendronephthya gigantea]XP_028394989.1 uncharacterized protein LOC114519117 [Dendronephthya gigantea]